MRYYYREITSREIVTHYGKKDFVTRIEFFKTNDQKVLDRANFKKRYKFYDMTDDADLKEYKIFLRHARANNLYVIKYNDYYHWHTGTENAGSI